MLSPCACGWAGRTLDMENKVVLGRASWLHSPYRTRLHDLCRHSIPELHYLHVYATSNLPFCSSIFHSSLRRRRKDVRNDEFQISSN